MQRISLLRRLGFVSSLTFLVLFANLNISSTVAANSLLESRASRDTLTPIKHVIVILGENHSFDNVFGDYTPVKGQSVDNLLSEGIITPGGNLGSKAYLAQQQQATNTGHL